MNRLLAPVGVIALVAIAVFIGASVLPANARTPSTAGSGYQAASSALAPQPPVTPPPGITVEGEGTVKTQPDVAYVAAGVQNTASSAQAAQQENARLMNAVVTKLQSMGFAQKDLRTTGLGIHPVYERNSPTPTGYRATNQVVVTVSDVGQAGAVFDAAVGAGANTAGNIRFSLKDDSQMRQQALREAVKSARAKADALAGELGLRISGVSAVLEEGISSPVQPQVERMAAAPADMPPTPVIPGELSVTARVRVIYAF